MVLVLSEWMTTRKMEVLELDGDSLTISRLVAVADGGLRVRVSDAAAEAMRENNKFLQESIANGGVIYGINTGFGASADVRSSDVEEIQRALVMHTNVGQLGCLCIVLFEVIM